MASMVVVFVLLGEDASQVGAVVTVLILSLKTLDYWRRFRLLDFTLP